jgi:hypothetical protein
MENENDVETMERLYQLLGAIESEESSDLLTAKSLRTSINELSSRETALQRELREHQRQLSDAQELRMQLEHEVYRCTAAVTAATATLLCTAPQSTRSALSRLGEEVSSFTTEEDVRELLSKRQCTVILRDFREALMLVDQLEKKVAEFKVLNSSDLSCPYSEKAGEEPTVDPSARQRFRITIAKSKKTMLQL